MPQQLSLVPSAPRSRFHIPKFMQLLRVIGLAVVKGWPMTVIATRDPALLVIAAEPYVDEIKKEFGL